MHTHTHQGMHRLMRWLPSLDAVTKLDICSAHFVSPDSMKKALAQLNSLSSLSLRGKKVSAAVLTKASKQAAGLKELILADDADYVRLGQEAEKAFKDLIRSAPMLETLSIPKTIPFSWVAAAIKDARNGGDSLITRFESTGGFGKGISDVSRISDAFPEIETLRVDSIDAHTLPSATMPRLRTLFVSDIIGFMGPHLSTQQMGELINSILLACPALEDLSLAHGDVLSVRDREQGLPPSLPGTNGSLLNLPSSLRRFLSSGLTEDCPHSHCARELSS